MEKLISVPEERIGFIIGKHGRVKKQIEKTGNVTLKIEDLRIIISGKSLDVLKAYDVVRAMVLGFPKKEAFELFSNNMQLIVYELKEVIPDSQMKRVCGRIIGEKGKSKLKLQEMLNVNLLIKRERIGAIGKPMKLQILKEALDKLIRGASHASVYKHFDRRLLSTEIK